MILFFILFATAMMALPSFFIYMTLRYPISANLENQKQSPADYFIDPELLRQQVRMRARDAWHRMTKEQKARNNDNKRSLRLRIIEPMERMRKCGIPEAEIKEWEAATRQARKERIAGEEFDGRPRRPNKKTAKDPKSTVSPPVVPGGVLWCARCKTLKKADLFVKTSNKAAETSKKTKAKKKAANLQAFTSKSTTASQPTKALQPFMDPPAPQPPALQQSTLPLTPLSQAPIQKQECPECFLKFPMSSCKTNRVKKLFSALCASCRANHSKAPSKNYHKNKAKKANKAKTKDVSNGDQENKPPAKRTKTQRALQKVSSQL
ncbi:uncharacterized protein IWZ02DRAFT_489454 [Phyllosticta citriasiana]|uniref:uncharacterized protein n=1 Tax=Phyllosticta citriasiana TaxID=595635 RepID=UPI0030FDF384